MQQQNQNKEFILNYFNALRTDGKSREILEKYMTDEALIGHIEFFEKVFPSYDVIVGEMTAEDNRVVVSCHLKGTHLGELNGIAPTYKEVNVPFVISYQIENNKIASHWMLVDQMSLMQQLGVVPAAQATH